MADRAKYIKLAVENGVTELAEIRNTYNSYAEGGFTAGAITDAIYKGASEVEELGYPTHKYDFTQSEEWANAHGYFPDKRGHRDDRVKKSAHPTHPSRGTWNGDNFHLTELGMKDPNYIMFGMADGGQDPQATLYYDDAVVLPEFTVTPKGNYIHNSYDNLNIKFAEGGTKERWISTGNDTADTVLSFLPIVGTAMDIEEAIRNPSIENIAWAAGSIAMDLLGGSLIKGAMKSAKAASKATKLVEKANKAEKAYSKAYTNAKVNGGKKLNKTAHKKYVEMKKAQAERDLHTKVVKTRGVHRTKPVNIRKTPEDYSSLINYKSVYGTDLLLNGVNQYSIKE